MFWLVPYRLRYGRGWWWSCTPTECQWSHHEKGRLTSSGWCSELFQTLLPIRSQPTLMLIVYMYIVHEQYSPTVYAYYNCMFWSGDRVGLPPQRWPSTPWGWWEQGEEDGWHRTVGPGVPQGRSRDLVRIDIGKSLSLSLSLTHTHTHTLYKLNGVPTPYIHTSLSGSKLSGYQRSIRCHLQNCSEYDQGSVYVLHMWTGVSVITLYSMLLSLSVF